jgi:polyisoprenyl-phosphate glycosyltransferase
MSGYTPYGPLEDVSGRMFARLVDPTTSRDFVYVDDICDAFLLAAAGLTPDIYGEAFNIRTGRRTTISVLATIAADVFAVDAEPYFGR